MGLHLIHDAALGAFPDAMHQFKYMIAHFAAGAMGPVMADGPSHIGHPQPAVAVGVAVGERNLEALGGAVGRIADQIDGQAVSVGIGQD